MGKSRDRTWVHCSSNHSNTLIETIVHKYLTYSLNNLFKKVKRGLEAISMLSFQYKKNGIKAKKNDKIFKKKKCRKLLFETKAAKIGLKIKVGGVAETFGAMTFSQVTK